MQEEDGLLYHYTNQAGLCGIVKNKEIWASNALFVNDSSELNQAYNLMRKMIPTAAAPQGLFGDAISQLEYFVYDRLIARLNFFEDYSKDIDIFIASFTRFGDQLSQWQGYCKSGVGYSLGFDSTKLRAIIAHNEYNLIECIYNEDEQVKQLRPILMEFQRKFEQNKARLSMLFTEKVDLSQSENSPSNQEFFEILNSMDMPLFASLMRTAPICKNAMFHEEAELRLISPPTRQNIEFRPGKSYFVPYVKVPLKNDSFGFPLKRVYIGPCPNPALNRLSVEKLLRSIDGLGECEIINSSIPFRDW